MEIVILLIANGARPQVALDINERVTGAKLDQKSLDFLRSSENIIKLCTIKHFEKKKKMKTFLTQCSEGQF